MGLLRARLRLIPLVETYVESRHKDIKAEGKTFHRISSSRVSLRLRGKEIEQQILDGEFFASLAELCSKLRNMSGVLQGLHLSTHSAIRSRIEEAGNADFDVVFCGQDNHSLVEKVIYRRDPNSQFRDLSDFKSDIGPGKGLKRKANGGEHAGALASILNSAATDHFRKLSSPAAFFSHKPNVKAGLVPLGFALSAQTRILFDAADGLLRFSEETCEVNDDNGRSESASGPPSSGPASDDSRTNNLADHVFFRVMHKAPATQALANEALLKTRDIIVCVHACKSVSKSATVSDTKVCLDLQQHQQLHRSPDNAGVVAASGPCVWTVPKFTTIAEVRAQPVIEWEAMSADFVAAKSDSKEQVPPPGVLYRLFGVQTPGVAPAQMDALIQQLAQAGALPAVDEDLEGAAANGWRLVHEGHREELRALEAMGRAGWVSCSMYTDVHSEWSLTRQAISSMSLSVQVTRPRLIFAVRSGVAADDFTLWELIATLDSRGWTHSMLGPKISRKKATTPWRRPAADATKPDLRSRIWWSRQSDGPSRLYLLALVKADDIFECVPIQSIDHLMPVQCYELLLDGKFPVKKAYTHVENGERIHIVFEDDSQVQSARAKPKGARSSGKGGKGFARGRGRGKGSMESYDVFLPRRGSVVWSAGISKPTRPSPTRTDPTQPGISPHKGLPILDRRHSPPQSRKMRRQRGIGDASKLWCQQEFDDVGNKMCDVSKDVSKWATETSICATSKRNP